MAANDRCDEPRLHQLHLCQLLREGEMEELDRRRAKPTVVCCRCGFTAHAAGDVCQPRPLQSHRTFPET